MKIKLRALISAIICMVVSACGSNETGKTCNVLVLHRMDSLYHSISVYDRVFEKTLKDYVENADIRNVYECDIDRGAYSVYIRQFEALKEKGWTPDVICVSDDNTLESLVRGEYARWLFVNVDSIPIVAAGLHSPDWELLREFSNIAICTDLIDFKTNLELAKSISGHSVILTELDYDDYDIRLRERLNSETNLPPFVNNSDFHVRNIFITRLNDYYRDSIFINVFSNASPEYNQYSDNPVAFRKRVLENLPLTPFLMVKKDQDSDDVLNHCRTPQFSAIREGFADNGQRLLCGYFASDETVAEDQAAYVVRILEGISPNELPLMSHRRSYYADWHSMKLMGYSHRDFSKPGGNPAGVSFKIINAPFYIQHTIGFILLLFLSTVFTVNIIAYFSRLKFKRSARRIDKSLRQLERERDMFTLALQGTDCIIIEGPDDIVALQRRMHPDDADILNGILSEFSGGIAVKETIIRLTEDNGRTWRRWQFRGCRDEKEHDDVCGVLIDVDETIKFQEQMAEIERVAEEIRQKENFVKNISHEIRTPLNAIVGYSQVLGMDDGSLSDQERFEISQDVHDSNRLLAAMIEDILQFSRLESGRVEVDMVETDISKLMFRIYNEWASSATHDVEFMLDHGRPGVYAMVDPQRIQVIMGQFLRNAFKFTKKGYVKLGWNYDLDSETVLLYVEDTGRGISEDKRQYIFNLFWKDDMFTSGVGIGLTIAKTFTEKMDGKTVVQSRKDVGSRFGSQFKAYIKL